MREKATITVESVSMSQAAKTEPAESASGEKQVRRATRILCIDTEPETADALKRAGFSVQQVEIGYRSGQRRFVTPPHETDLIVCDLRRPACFDSKDWGPYGHNDNYRCKIVPFEQVSNTAYLRNKTVVMQHQLIQETQLPQVIPGTFGPADVMRAISEAGVPAVLFLNHEWASRAVYSSPNFVGLRWEFKRTTATKVEVTKPLADILPEVGSKIRFQLALQDAIAAGPEARPGGKSRPPSKPIVSNSVGDVFGQVVQLGKGTVWLLPQTQDNPAVIALLASRIEQLKTIRIEQPHAGTAPATTVAAVVAAAQGFWKDLHPEIVKVAKSRFETGHYADAIEASLKEVNDRVRALVKKQIGQELDGKDLMERAFSVKNPVLALDDLSTVTGRNIQVGYMQIFAGSMTGIRNPKAHANITITRLRAIHFLYLASLLMYRVDEAAVVKP